MANLELGQETGLGLGLVAWNMRGSLATWLHSQRSRWTRFWTHKVWHIG